MLTKIIFLILGLYILVGVVLYFINSKKSFMDRPLTLSKKGFLNILFFILFSPTTLFRKSSIIKTKNSKEFLISELEKTYSGFKSFNPDADEHWLLINTYLARYGNYEDQKQKGPELMKYIAFKDTFQFSFLKAPDSIRALGFYLIYKVLGEEEYEPYAEEFNKLYEKIQMVFEKRNLLEEYKRINPFTYIELQSEKDNTEWSLMGLLESSDYLNKNPDAQDFASKIMGDL